MSRTSQNESGANHPTWLLTCLLLGWLIPAVSIADLCSVNAAQGAGLGGIHNGIEFRSATASACVYVADQGDRQVATAHELVDLGDVFGGSWTYVGRAHDGRHLRLDDNLLAPDVRVGFGLESGSTTDDRIRGTYTMRWDDVSTPTRLDLAVVIDLGGGWAGLVFSTDLFSGTGSMTQNWEVERADRHQTLPPQPALSLYARTTTVPCLDCGGTHSLPVPSPAWLLLIGAGLFSWGLRYRQG